MKVVNVLSAAKLSRFLQCGGDDVQQWRCVAVYKEELKNVIFHVVLRTSASVKIHHHCLYKEKQWIVEKKFQRYF